MNCILCDEPFDKPTKGVMPPVTVSSLEGPGSAHRECMLREVIGGIGHLIAHQYWCVQQHDPDGGLTYRQSALLAWQYNRILGTSTNKENQ